MITQSHTCNGLRELIIRKDDAIPRHAELAQGVPGGLRPRIFLTFGTIRVVGRQPYAPTAFTPGEIPGFCREPRKKSLVAPPEIDPGTSRLVAQPTKG